MAEQEEGTTRGGDMGDESVKETVFGDGDYKMSVMGNLLRCPCGWEGEVLDMCYEDDTERFYCPACGRLLLKR